MSSPDRLADPRPGGSDQAGNWLSERYQLNAADRKRVKMATLRGEPVSDPRLNEAVRGLASEILDNRLRLPGIVLYYVIGAVNGLIGIGALAIALSPSGQHGHYEKILILLVVLASIAVVEFFLWLPRQMRRRVKKALRVNNE
jgi:glucose-6-phosphate-specific signal transduction histidine kinase